jgi:hypothetical protein
MIDMNPISVPALIANITTYAINNIDPIRLTIRTVLSFLNVKLNTTKMVAIIPSASIKNILDLLKVQYNIDFN